LLEQVGISVLYEQSWSGDGSAWSGGSIAGCVRVAGVCIGGRVRGAFEPRLAANGTAASRSDLSLLATLSLPLEAGQMRFIPELGLGVGRFTTKRLDGCAAEPPPNCDPTDPMCLMSPPTPSPGCDPNTMNPDGTVNVGDDLAEASYTPRAAVALRIAVPLFRHVWLDGLASFTIAPFAHGESYDSPTSPTMPSPELGALPGEPSSSYQLGVGLRIGAP
jgi:hypothetical protein